MNKLQLMLFEEYKKNGYLKSWTYKKNDDEKIQVKLDLAEVGLINTEVSEALEKIRDEEYGEELAKELSDIVIRVLNFGTRKNIDVMDFILIKHIENMKRGFLHNRSV